jgi:hypothetical protein
VPWGILSCELLPIIAATRDRSLAHFAILEKNDPLAQGRILPCQEGVEGWPIQVRHMQITHNHVIVPFLELGEGLMAIARRADAIAIPAQQACQGAEHAWLIVNH